MGERRTVNEIMKWCEQQTIDFVKEYVKHECLYNVNCVQYRSKRLRDAALLSISQNLNIPDFGPKEVYKKIRSIKSTYSQELKKIKFRNKSDAGKNNYKPHLRWFNILHDAMVVVNSPMEYSDIKNGVETFSSPEDQQMKRSLVHDSNAKSKVESQAGSETALLTNNDVNPVTRKASNIRRYPRKRTKNDLDNPSTKGQAANKTNNVVQQTEHEFDIFGKSIAAQLKNMPLDKAIEAQMVMQNYLSGVRLKNMRGDTSQESSSSNSSYTVAQCSPSPTASISPAPTPSPSLRYPEVKTEY